MLLRDREAKFPAAFDAVFGAEGVRVVRTPVRAPRADAFAERRVGTVRRELVRVRVTAHPTAAWVWRQLIEAMPWGRRPKDVLRDRDAVYGRAFASKAQRLGIDTLLTPFRAPQANAVAERVVRTLRQERLARVLILSERHLERVLWEYVRHFNADRPHRSLGLTPPLPGVRASAASAAAGRGVARPVLGGLHHAYSRAA